MVSVVLLKKCFSSLWSIAVVFSSNLPICYVKFGPCDTHVSIINISSKYDKYGSYMTINLIQYNFNSLSQDSPFFFSCIDRTLNIRRQYIYTGMSSFWQYFFIKITFSHDLLSQLSIHSDSVEKLVIWPSYLD